MTIHPPARDPFGAHDEEARMICHQAHEQYQAGRITRDDGYSRCRQALMYASLSLMSYVYARTCWFCGTSQFLDAKTCEVCGARIKRGMRCSAGLHDWEVVHDTGKNVYEECSRCHARRIRDTQPGMGYQPIDREWLNGAPWRREPPRLPDGAR